MASDFWREFVTTNIGLQQVHALRRKSVVKNESLSPTGGLRRKFVMEIAVFSLVKHRYDVFLEFYI